jgi:hypothetical protein
LLKVITELSALAQRIFFFAAHKQQSLLMRLIACIVSPNGPLISKADAS